VHCEVFLLQQVIKCETTRVEGIYDTVWFTRLKAN